MSLSQWNAFVEVCRTGSIRAAAEATGFTQSGVSRQLAALERSLGVRLVVRGSRGATPTAQGVALLPHARIVVNEARRGRDAARAAIGNASSLMLGAVPSATAGLVPLAVAALAAAEGPRCFVVSALTSQLSAMVLARELDAAVITDAPPGLPRDGELQARLLLDDEMVVIAPPGHPLAGRERVDVEELAEEVWVEDNAGSEALLRQLAARAGFEPRLSSSADDLVAKTGLVAAGLGIALVPGLLVPALRPDLTILRLEHPTRRGVYLLARLDRGEQLDLANALSLAAARFGAA